MKEADLQIRIGVINKLSPVFPNYPIRDYMFVEGVDEMPGILLSTQTTSDESPKTNFQIQSTLLIQIIDKKSLTVSRYTIDSMTDTLLQTLVPQDGNDYISVTGFKICHVALDSKNDDVIQENDGASARKLIRLRFTLFQIS